ncbi:hypothetical protein DFH07DRAFT_820308 [Mycena maculata]|uniref:Uncharacterized protein n=1 Tax=Mycena maculata TaxID=230809 RepID=A0AAD7NE62_9AGAR|nr:hypothetical protein DFH07DRAFT_820308 [Mycena maculata]
MAKGIHAIFFGFSAVCCSDYLTQTRFARWNFGGAFSSQSHCSVTIPVRVRSVRPTIGRIVINVDANTVGVV